MYTTNKSTKSIADAALKVMMGEAKSPAQQAAIAIAMKEKGQKPKEEMKEAKLHPNQQKLDVHEPEKDELTAKDFEMLRKGKKAKVSEGTVAGDILKKIDEMKGPWPGTPEYNRRFPEAPMKPGQEKATKTGVVKKTIKGIVHTQRAIKEEVEIQQEEQVKILAKEEVSFQNLINLYIDNGVEALLQTVESLKEESTNDEFHNEVEENKKKAEGKVEQPEVAKGAVKAVAVTKEEVELEEMNLSKTKIIPGRQTTPHPDKTKLKPERPTRPIEKPKFDALKKEEVEQVDEGSDSPQTLSVQRMTHSQGLGRRKPAEVTTQGPRAGLITRKHATSLKQRITSAKNLGVNHGPMRKLPEEVELDEANTETKKEFQARQQRLAAAHSETQKDPKRLARLMKIPGYADAMALANKTTQKEEVEQMKEGSDSPQTLPVQKMTSSFGLKRRKPAEVATQGSRKGLITRAHATSLKQRIISAKNLGVNHGPMRKLPEEVEQIEEELHPAAAQVLKHIKPEHHGVYKPYLKKNVFNGSYKDRADVLSAAERAGHAMKEEVEQVDEASANRTLPSRLRRSKKHPLDPDRESNLPSDARPPHGTFPYGKRAKPPSDAIAARWGRKSGSATSARFTKATHGFGIAGPKKKLPEEVEHVNEDMKSAAQELKMYADKHGGIDKADFHKAAKHMEAGDHNSLHKHIQKLDSDPRDKILITLHNHGNDIERYGYSKLRKEDIEQIDEASYSAKAARAGEDIGKPGKMFSIIAASAAKRYGSEEKGRKVAGALLANLRKEEVEELTDEQIEMIFEQIDIQLNERSLSEPEMKKREEIVKGMKKNIEGFKSRYGKDAKSVMYATATERAKGN